MLSAKSLESLPPRMRDLRALNFLLLSGAEKLRSLPDLPSSLQWLHVMGCCPELEAQIRVKDSPEWNKISHIPKVHIAAARPVQSRPHIFHGTYASLWSALLLWVAQISLSVNQLHFSSILFTTVYRLFLYSFSIVLCYDLWFKRPAIYLCLKMLFIRSVSVRRMNKCLQKVNIYIIWKFGICNTLQIVCQDNVLCISFHPPSHHQK